MSIAIFKKISLLGLTHSKKRTVNKLQELGCIHVISTQLANKSTLLAPVSTTPLDQIKITLKYLKDSPAQARQRIQWKEFKSDDIVKRALENQSALRDAIDRQDFLVDRIRNLSEWGHFNIPSDQELSGFKLWFYKIKSKEIALLPKDKVIKELYRNNQFIYIVMIAKEEPKEEPFFSRRVWADLSLNDLNFELETVKENIDDLIDERRHLTRYRYLLSREVALFTDRTQLQSALEKIKDHEEFYLLQGWVPQEQLMFLETFCRQHQLGMIIEKPAEDELPPTLLKTEPWLQAGQELVNFYQTPGYHSLDPSIMVFFSFSLFFAMILSDAGYGLILALFTLIGWKWLGKSNKSAWLRPLLVVISIFSIIYGVLVGSYWGVEPKTGTFLASLKIIDIKNFKTMMALVIVIGCIHICVASGMRAWFSKHLSERIQAVGFICFILSALILAAGLLYNNKQMSDLATVSLILSLLVIMFFASSEPVTNVRTFVVRIFRGITALMELPSLFGDILSYLRLFALGLAGSSLAITFNTIADQVAQTNWVLALLILIFGQTLNFALCLMGAVIHGLRLNYIEFFKWSIKEEGYVYQPLKKQEITHE